MDRRLISISHFPADTTEPLHEVSVGQLLCAAAADAPDRTALIEGDPDPSRRRRWTYDQLLAESEAAARALLLRFVPGDHVAVWAPNRPEWIFLELGAALAGLVLVTVNPAYRATELAYVLRQSRAKGLFLVREHRGHDMAGALAEVRSELPELRHVVSFDDWAVFSASGRSSAARCGELPGVSPSAPVQIQYTSGTTGRPKGALLHHRGMVNNARFTAVRGRMGECWINAVPLFHSSGGGLAVFGPLWERATLIVVPQFDPGLMLELIEAERVTFLPGVPTMLLRIIEHPDFERRDLTSLRAVCSGGTTVPAELVRRIEQSLGVDFSISYGQTEASPGVTQTFPDDSIDDKSSTAGPPLPQTEVKIVDTVTGETLPCGEIGELCTRGYLVMHGYFEMPEETAKAIDAEGWLHTGDLCSMDDRGYVRVHGRTKDMIIRGGENIYPKEIEDVLFLHPAVAEVAVIGVPDREWGEQVAAFIRAAPGIARPDERELHAHVREHLAHYKTPRHWRFVDEFPLNASGKILKTELRARWARSAIDKIDPSV
ncbi:MAG TPA: AMP-binding protein [Thermoanaerobaculia bacterium]|nr:AMP-binding protein [Thermoanaerobaculia bacterium]